ncbi:MAG: alpha/beta fold hydrolase [Acidimicrobiales bacterium]|nr:alpha/beta fold hydrolase [Acidimicrobiales bacterium]
MLRHRVATFASIVVAAGVTLLAGTPDVGAQASPDPTYSVATETLDAALDCDAFTHPDKEPVLLVHGTFTSGHEQWDWNYGVLLRETGHDVCVVTYPDRGLGDQQTSAEYIARAVQRIHAESGRKVDMVGHSQGASMPRWAVKWWPSVQEALDDFVLLAGPVHGTSLVSGALPTGMPPAFFQFDPSSEFVRVLNEGDETPGAVDYTSIYTRYDELVQPVDPPTAALDPGLDNPKVANILLQDVCPGNVSDHVTIGTIDRLTQILTLDALDNDGPTDVGRVGVDPLLCALEGLYVVPDTFVNLVDQFERSAAGGLPGVELVTEEPALRDYAVGSPDTDDAGPGDADTPTAPDTAVPSTADTGAPVAVVTPSTASRSERTLAATGRAIPILAAGVAIGVALLLRMGRSRLDDLPPDDRRSDAGSPDVDPSDTDG